MSVWEYKVVEFRTGAGMPISSGLALDQQTILNRFGADGWELIAVENHGTVTAYFKREKRDAGDGRGNPEGS